MKIGDFVKCPYGIGIVEEIDKESTNVNVAIFNGISVVTGWWAQETLTLVTVNDVIKDIPRNDLLRIIVKPKMPIERPVFDRKRVRESEELCG